MTEAPPDLAVGDRVQDVDGFRATVRYIGDVAGAKPEYGWVGLEWDADGRGKHDGSAKGSRYFQCPPGRGSFVRPDAVLAPRVTFQVRTVLPGWLLLSSQIKHGVKYQTFVAFPVYLPTVCSLLRNSVACCIAGCIDPQVCQPGSCERRRIHEFPRGRRKEGGGRG